MKRPIMLWITSRSRSSMVSAIFIEHGVWWGNTPATISGYQMNENQNIKALLKRYKDQYWKKVHLTPVPTKWNKQFIKDLSKIVPSDQIWMMKTGVEYFPAFKDLNPYNIFVYRNPEDVARSLCEKRKDVKYDDALFAAKWRYEYMHNLQTEYGGVFVDTDKTIQGDYTDIQTALAYCSINYDVEAVKRAINV